MAALLPLTGARAVPASVRIQYGFDLRATLSKATDNGTNPAWGDIKSLYIAGNGKLTKEDGEFLRTSLPNVTLLDLSGYEGEFEAEAFAENTSLQRVVLPEGARLSRKMFFACTSLAEVAWPDHYTLANDCFSYCALDFSGGYPALLRDHNVDLYAANQRPLACFSLPGGDTGTIRAGEGFADPTAIHTPAGADYRALVKQDPQWLVTLPSDLAVSQTVLYNGERVNELDTTQPGIHTIIYTLPPTTPADNLTLSYNLIVLTEDGQLPLELSGLPEEVRVGEAFALTCASEGAENSEYWHWDEKYFSAKFESPATFTPLQAGTSVITYTGPGGEIGEVQVTVLPADAEPAAQDAGGAGRGLLPVGIFIVVVAAGIGIALWLRRRPLPQPVVAAPGPKPEEAEKGDEPPAGAVQNIEAAQPEAPQTAEPPRPGKKKGKKKNQNPQNGETAVTVADTPENGE